MKAVRELPAELAERLELPEDLLPGSGRLTLSGGRQALVEGHRGILEYTPERGYGYKNVILNGYIPGTKTLIISQMGGCIAQLIFERSTRLSRPSRSRSRI